MNSMNRSLFFKIAILVAILAFVSCLSDRGHQIYKKKVNRGIILKCQGNPIACYGKRSLQLQPSEDSEQQQQQQQSSEETETAADALLQEYKYEKQLEILIRNCKLGVEKACNTMLEIMLMNSNNN